MKELWEAERVVTPAAARELIESQFSDLKVAEISLLGNGWDNTAFLVNGNLVFRFPRRKVAVTLMKNECRVLPSLAQHLELSIPVPEWTGRPTDSFSWPFAGYRLIPGQTACRAGLSDEERVAASDCIADFLKQLHSLPSVEAPQCHLPGDVIGKLDVGRLTARTRECLTKVANTDFWRFSSLLKRLYKECGEIEQQPGTTVVHGDFYVRHLVVDDNRKLTGIIDWGDVHIGNPALDLSIAHSFLPPQAHARFRERYGRISDETWQLARMRAAFYGVVLANYGVSTDDKAISGEAFKILSYLEDSL